MLKAPSWGFLFFIHREEQEYPAQYKKHAANRRYRAQHCEAGKRQHVQAAGEKQYACSKEYRSVADGSRLILVHQRARCQQRKSMIKLVADGKLKSIGPAGFRQQLFKTVCPESPDSNTEARHDDAGKDGCALIHFYS